MTMKSKRNETKENETKAETATKRKRKRIENEMKRNQQRNEAFEFYSNCEARGGLAVQIEFKCIVWAPFLIDRSIVQSIIRSIERWIEQAIN